MSSMPRCVWAVIATLLLLASNSTFAQETVPGWHSNLAQAQKLAEESGKPLFIVFRCVR